MGLKNSPKIELVLKLLLLFHIPLVFAEALAQNDNQ